MAGPARARPDLLDGPQEEKSNKQRHEMNWKLSLSEKYLVSKIVDRAAELALTSGRLELRMDLTACHLNGCELNLERLLEFPDFDFCHAPRGISRHSDRTDGTLTDFLVPRCAAPERATP
jgi:hypothetical protein